MSANTTPVITGGYLIQGIVSLLICLLLFIPFIPIIYIVLLPMIRAVQKKDYVFIIRALLIIVAIILGLKIVPIDTITFLIITLILSWYFLPSMIAKRKNRRNTLAIFALNLLLGWTLLGWVGALVWALIND